MRDSPSCDNMVTFLMISDHCFILFSFLPNFFIYFQEFIVKFYHIFFKITILLNNFIKYFLSIQYFFVIFISCMWLYHQYKSFYTVKASDLFIFLFQRRRDINKEPARRAFLCHRTLRSNILWHKKSTKTTHHCFHASSFVYNPALYISSVLPVCPSRHIPLIENPLN